MPAFWKVKLAVVVKASVVPTSWELARLKMVEEAGAAGLFRVDGEGVVLSGEEVRGLMKHGSGEV